MNLGLIRHWFFVIAALVALGACSSEKKEEPQAGDAKPAAQGVPKPQAKAPPPVAADPLKNPIGDPPVVQSVQSASNADELSFNNNETDNLSEALKQIVKVPKLVATKLPANPSRLLYYTVTIGGEYVEAYRYKYGPKSSMDCADLQDYSGAIVSTTALVVNISSFQNQELRLCIKGLNEDGLLSTSENSVDYSWVHNSQVPSMVSSYFVKALNQNSVQISFNKSSPDIDQVLVVRRYGAGTAWVPPVGAEYTAGQEIEAGTIVVYQGNQNTFTDSPVDADRDSYYTAFSRSATGIFSSGITKSGSAILAGAEVIVEQGLNNTVRALSVDGSGRTYVGGSFTSYTDKKALRIARFNAESELDLDYLNNVNLNGDVYALEALADGKLILGGTFTQANKVTRNRLTKFLENGTLDSSFNIGTGLNSTAYAITSDPSSGAIFIGGSFTTVAGASSNRIVKLDKNGARMTAFAVGTGFNSDVYAMKLDASRSRLYVAGKFTTYKGQTANYFVCLDSNTGDVCGKFLMGSGFNNITRAVGLNHDGSVVYVGGSFTTFNGVTNNRFVALDSEGNLSSSFSLGTGFNNIIQAMHVSDTGLITLGGTFTTYQGKSANRMIRLMSNGSFDSSFSLGVAANNQVLALAHHPKNASMIVGGLFTSIQNVMRQRVGEVDASSGALKNSFVGGVGLNNFVYNFEVDPASGDLFSYGAFTAIGAKTFSRVLRYDPTLSVDDEFVTGVGFDNTVYSSIGYAENQTILLGGVFTKYNNVAHSRVVRLFRNGKIDTSFKIKDTLNNAVNAMLAQSSGGTILGGSFTKAGTATVGRITRVDASGLPDNTFVTGTGANNVIRTLAATANGEIVFVGGDFTAWNGTTVGRFVLLNAQNGTLISPSGAGFGGAVNVITAVPGNRFLVGGAFKALDGKTRNYIMMLKADGTEDSSFSCGACFNGQVRAITYDPSTDSVFLGGDFTTYNGVAANRIINISLAGANLANPSFGTGFDNSVYGIKILHGYAYVGGNFSTFNGSYRDRMVRISLSPDEE